ncbi:hypothetical protein ACP70R_047322 [Stipagrostis hirtigluma subsp. patula]
MADLALGAVSSLLGLIRDETVLLSGVRGDIQFIKDEMESMNSFLLHLARTTPPGGEHDEQVRTWMKQVRDLAQECSNCIDLYVQRRDPELQRARGLRGFLCWLPWLVRALAAQHRAATQLRELKIRARDVGERRLRYGVEVPKGQGDDGEAGLAVALAASPAGGERERAYRVKDPDHLRSALAFSEPDILEEYTRVLLRRLAGAGKGEEEEGGGEGSRPRVIAVAAPDMKGANDLVQRVRRRLSSSLHPSLQFECQAWLKFPKCSQDMALLNSSWQLLTALLGELLHPGRPICGNEMTTWENMNDDQLAIMIADHLQVKGKRSLIILEGFDHEHLWNEMELALRAFGCAAGSAVIVTTSYEQVAKELMRWYSKEPVIYSLFNFFYQGALEVVNGPYHNITEYQLEEGARPLVDILHDIFKKCEPHAFCMKLFLHSLYANPHWSKQELEGLCRTLVRHEPLESSASKMLLFCYNGLPKDSKSCLLYLAIFDREQAVRRSRLVGRWVAEGLVTGEDWSSSVHQAEQCFDALVDRWFVTPGPAGISTTGKVKSCVLHQHLVQKFVIEMARKERFLDPRLSHHLAWHFSINSGLWLRRSDTIEGFLGVLPPSSQLHLVKVLDLEGCVHLEKNKHQYIKNICNKMLLLKYLSLRRTSTTILPVEINKLQQLEVLDIRETKVDHYSTRYILLPKLKRLLGGVTSNNATIRTAAEEPFTTFVKTPEKIHKMVYLEVLSNVEFSSARDASNLKTIARLWLLRKLGVVVYNKQSHIHNLFAAISDMNECLQSLSVEIKRLPGTEDAPPPEYNLNTDPIKEVFKNSPKYLRSLNMNDITGTGLLLPLLLKGSDRLAKVTLSNTLLNQNNVEIHLAKIPKLRSLRLRSGSYVESMLSLKKDNFRNLEYLLIEDSNITHISFDYGAAPKLEKIVWYFTRMESLSGINNLPMLKEIELHGSSIPDQVREAIATHPNHPILVLDQPAVQGEATASPRHDSINSSLQGFRVIQLEE